MFGGDGDPFRNPFDHMHRQMRQMDNMMNAMLGDAFDMLNNFGAGMPRHPMLTDDPRLHQPGHHQRARQPFNDDMMLSPFGGFGFGGGIFGGLMQQMQNVQERAMDDPNSIVISQSTMISHDGNGQPKIVQSSTRKAGDVKETRKTLREGEREEMTIGHSLGNKSHIIEKKRDRDGRIRQQQKFVNMQEDEAMGFNERFRSRAQENLSGFAGGIFGGRSEYQALEDGKRRNRNAGPNSTSYHQNFGETSTPIITIPDDEEDEQPRRNGNRRNENVVYSNNGTGPTIQEISEDDVDNTNPKRRKGVFKFLG